MSITLTPGPLPTIDAGGRVLTLAMARQLDTCRAETITALQAIQPIARVRADRHTTGIEVLGIDPVTNFLIRAIVPTNQVLHHAAAADARQRHQDLQDAIAWAEDMPLALLPTE